MPSTATDRIDGLTTSVAVKAPCVAATTANITLSGLQTVGGVALAVGDRVLVKDQTDQRDNGIYVAATSAWARARDFDGTRDVVQGTIVIIVSAASVATETIYRVTTTNPVAFGSSSITFVESIFGAVDSLAVTFLQAGTGAVSRTARDKMRDWISVKDFGAVGDGSTDDTAAINHALTAGGYVFMPVGTYKITSALALTSGVVLFGAGQGLSIIQCANGDISQIVGSAISRATLCDFTLNVTGAGTTGVIGGISFTNATTYCTVERVEVKGVSWAGVLIQGSSYNTVRGCNFNNFAGSVQDAADVAVYQNSQFNTVADNLCYGGKWHGVFIQDPGGATLPYKNIVRGNHIGAHSAYGIINYMITHADTFNVIEGNFIEGILGTNPGAAQGGAGIYNQGAGGTDIVGNNIRNCCVSTGVSSLTPAGIGINNIGATLQPPNVSGNVITDMAQYHGIYVATCDGGANVQGNTVRVSASAGTQGNGIYANSSSRLNIAGNRITVDITTQGRAITMYGQSATITNINITGNTCIGGNYAGVELLADGGGVATSITVTGNTISGGGTSAIPIRATTCANVVVSGNSCSATTAAALAISACTVSRFTGNVLLTTGTSSVTTTGTCTSSYFDKSNYVNGSFINAATGLIAERLGGVPEISSGNGAVGDRVEQSVPAIGSPKGWRCTVAGAPGTWVSEGNL